MNIAVVGLGYVGSVSCACLAELGHTIVGVDVQEEKVRALQEGKTTLVEPELDALTAAGVAAGRIRATLDPCQAVRAADVSLICVGTPSAETGEVNLGFLDAACRQVGAGIAQHPGRHVVAIRSTVPPGTVRDVAVPALEAASHRTCGPDFGVCTHPEFLREGSAVADFRHPPMIVIGELSPPDGDAVAGLYPGVDSPVYRCSPDEAMMVKYACNAFHATKVAFANEIGSLCRTLGLDSHLVMEVFVQDRQLNISPKYLRPGFAFGGSCLPKDVRGLLAMGHREHLGLPLLGALLPSNRALIDRALAAILHHKPRRVAMLGLSFKDKTDDLRESPLVETAERLVGKGVDLAIYDPDVRVSRLFGGNLTQVEQHLPHLASLLREDLNEVIAHGEVVVVCKPSPAFRALPQRLRPGQHVVDLARLFAPGELPAGQYETLTG